MSDITDTSDAPDAPDARGPSAGILPAAVEELVERWFRESFHGSPAARLTEVWNHVHAAKDELKRRLAAFLARV